ncbi:NADH dehydrogenase [ubiquinone] 1 alpha subcomplex subunit 2 isoform X2 [Sphaerodactylus townsendi]|uniref:NADH dehydrogenase [ubiquinone] 1 alpha subcomplex subunit 2 isoform X2 n=1 Tax=Sphaerodactylus townsendi TaxID=933632 RepID=UPI0020263F5B|nr:NADH dehydrogenase [ubiquinone] 1 alpha subcomplex subunit 2 isoform X2 [Sphaerodactylus townsendi]
MQRAGVPTRVLHSRALFLKLTARIGRGVWRGRGSTWRRVRLCGSSGATSRRSGSTCASARREARASEFGRETSIPLNNLNVDQVAKAVETVIHSKA